MLFEGGKEFVGVGVDTQIDDFKSGSFKHHRHKIFANVVNVALDRADDDFAY